MSCLYIITGPAGVGKSTISKALAEKMEKSALIEGDDIYHLVCGGYVKPWLEGNHLEVFWENCVDLIMNFLNRGYDVVFNYICTPLDIEYIKNKVKDTKIKLCIMITNEETLIKRDKMRPLDYQMGERSIILLNEFIMQDYNEKYYLDTTLLNVEETVDKIIKNDSFLLWSS
ncbi:AAA family ATPase [Parasporobacterium paucivorans]|uniref:AAA domain-containing protein n=1 Tax=Parasporobacterium paucivorans DSM 15970 TaxID=1122934 RepID=A0A1M6CW95_9FIRM|nr:AAA family ATPase [Parasporobacterium paucivorans]SHI65229.1 AAA domain-containing protein [Parasporobacterium paucivorans DSM 15970]